MRLLLDECVPRKFKHLLQGHDVSTAREMGWSGLRNGDLIALMRQRGFEVLVTVDQNIEFQQNLRPTGIAVLLLTARSNRFKDLAPLAAPLLAKLASLKPGFLEKVSAQS